MHLRRRRQVTAVGVAAVATALSLAACSSSSSSPAAGGGSSSTPAGGSPAAGGAKLNGTLNGSGSTFQLTFQQAAISAFKSVQSGMTVNYGGGGSGKGRTDLASGVVQYAGSDSTIPSAEEANFKGKTALYFPVVIGPISVAYNLSGVTTLKLTPDVIAEIFQGKITSWNNSAITSINPGVSLPSTSITIAVRSDSSGTTQNFSLFLEKAAPSTASATAAADGVTVASNLTFHAVWATGAQAYPITYQSWVLAYETQSSSNNTKMLQAYIGYLLGAGQQLLPELGYAPLPSNLDNMAKAQLSKIGM